MACKLHQTNQSRERESDYSATEGDDLSLGSTLDLHTLDTWKSKRVVYKRSELVKCVSHCMKPASEGAVSFKVLGLT